MPAESTSNRGLLAIGVTTLAFSATVITAGQPAASNPGTELSVLRDAPLTHYRAYRRMHAKNEKFNQEAWLDVWTELSDGRFRYEITSERGSDYIRNRVLKTILIREQELVAQGDAERAEISAENYVFEEANTTTDGTRSVLLKPKRKDVLLVNGRMLLNPEGTELLRVEGTLAKNPSFWTSLVTIVRDFARVEGVRVPVSIESTAKLKLAGQARLDIRYEYESINGRRVSPVAQASGLHSPRVLARASLR